MSLWSNFLGFFTDDGTLSLEVVPEEIEAELYFKQLAVQSCVNILANTISKSEFKTFEKGVEVRKSNYYLFNVEPNQNKNASKFWRDVINKLVYENECLVVQINGSLYIAESFTQTKNALKDNVYANVMIQGNYTLSDMFYEKDVLFFELHNKKINAVIDGIYKSYGELIAVSQSHYKKNNAKRGKLTVPTNYPQTDKAKEKLEDLVNKQIKRFYEAEGGAVLPLTNGLGYEELASNIGAKGSIEGRDIRAFIDDIFDFVAVAFSVPVTLIKGDIADTEKAVDNLLTFGVNPLAEILTDEINRKMYGKKSYLERTYMKVDTSNVRAVDIKDIANALDVLTRIGAYCVDDSLQALGLEPLNTDWSKQRFMTKNYMPIEKMIAGGGE